MYPKRAAASMQTVIRFAVRSPGASLIPGPVDARAFIEALERRVAGKRGWDWTGLPVAAGDPGPGLKSVPPDEDLSTIMQILSKDDINQVPVIHDGNVVGIVGRDNIISFINLRGELEK